MPEEIIDPHTIIDELERGREARITTGDESGRPIRVGNEWIFAPIPMGPTIVGRGFSSENMLRYLDERLEVSPEAVPGSSPKAITAGMLRKLENAAYAIIQRNLVIRSPGDQGRREREYTDMLRNEKEMNKSPREIAASEHPVPVLHVTSGTLKQILNIGVVKGLFSDENGSTVCRCVTCDLRPPKTVMFICAERMYCALHVPELEACIRCRELSTACEAFTSFDGREGFVCASCAVGNSRCSECEETIGVEYVEVGMCTHCLDNTYSESLMRNFSYGLKWTGNKKGTIVKSPRLYSTEIEAVTNRAGGMNILSDQLPKECGLSTDASVDGEEGYGFETQTPRLQGAKGEELIHRVGAVLKQVEAYVNKSCGMHIHLDGKGILHASRKTRPTSLIQLWKAHLVFEDVMLSFLPYARRRNDFCRPMAEAFKLTEISVCDSLLDLEKLWYKERTYNEIRASKRHHYHSSRYFGVNFHSLLSHGHLEIRYHSGTTNPRKVLEWANFHALIMDAAAALKFRDGLLNEALATSVLKDKTQLLFDTIGLAESSQQYFFARQKKFGDKSSDE